MFFKCLSNFNLYIFFFFSFVSGGKHPYAHVHCVRQILWNCVLHESAFHRKTRSVHDTGFVVLLDSRSGPDARVPESVRGPLERSHRTMVRRQLASRVGEGPVNQRDGAHDTGAEDLLHIRVRGAVLPAHAADDGGLRCDNLDAVVDASPGGADQQGHQSANKVKEKSKHLD